jgi:hypothetical protein
MTLFPAEVDLDVGIDVGSQEPFKATPSYTELNHGSDHYVLGVSWQRGRSSVHADFAPGTATLILDNRDGRFDPDNTAGPYTATFGRGNPVLITATHSATATAYKQFKGYIDRISLRYERPMAFAIVECVETWAGVHTFELVEQVFALERSNIRIGNVLTLAGFPGGDRDLATAGIDCAAQTFSGTVGGMLTSVLQAEQGWLFQAGDGDLQFQRRNHFAGVSSTATFDDSSTLGYVDLTIEYDADSLRNQMTVTGSSGGAQTASNATSITKNGPVGESSTNLACIGEPGALNVAEWFVAKHALLQRRITSFTLKPQTDGANLWPEVLGLELNGLITIKYQPDETVRSCDELVQVVAIDSISHDVRPGDWTTTYTVHPIADEESLTYWILDDDDVRLGTDDESRLA